MHDVLSAAPLQALTARLGGPFLFLTPNGVRLLFESAVIPIRRIGVFECMPRPPRLDLPGLPQHLIVRGNDRTTMFFTDQDRMLFLRYLEEALDAADARLHAFVLMGNHVHLLATGNRLRALSRLMQSIGRRYARWINRTRRRTGTLFEGRFKSNPVHGDTCLLTCMRYIELNPVRAGMVQHPAEHPWSSFRQNASGAPAWMLTPHANYLDLDAEAEARGVAYRRLFAGSLSEEDLDAIRFTANKGAVLGSTAFAAELSAMTGREVAWRPPGRPRRKKVI